MVKHRSEMEAGISSKGRGKRQALKISAGGHSLLTFEPIKPFRVGQGAAGEWRLIGGPDSSWYIGHMVRDTDRQIRV
jgi:hypothetical protein